MNEFESVLYYIFNSLIITTASVFLAAAVGYPLSALLAYKSIKGKKSIQVILSSLTAIPTVVVGLFVYFIFSRSGPLGIFGLLYTKIAVIVGQFFLILPLTISLSWTVFESVPSGVVETLNTFSIRGYDRFRMIFKVCRVSLLSVLVTVWGRVMGEIGVSMMLGGNVRNARTVTTAIAFEANRGDFTKAMILGGFLILVSLFVNFLVHLLSRTTRESFDEK